MRSNKVIINLTILLILIIMSIACVVAGPLISENTKKYEKTSISLNLIQGMNQTNYVLNHKLKEKKENKAIKPSEYLIDETEILDYEDIDALKKGVDTELSNWNRELSVGLKNLEYYASDKDNKFTEKSAKKGIEALLKKDITQAELNEFNNYYSAYIAVEYDDKGKETIINSLGVNNSEFINNKLRNDFTVNSLKDTKFVYAIPKVLAYEDNISNMEGENDRSLEFTVYLALGCSSIVFLAIMFIPYRKERELLGFKFIEKSTFEYILIGFLIIFTCMGISIEWGDSLYGFGDNFELMAIRVVRFINVFISLTLVYLASLLLKHSAKIGITSYYKQNFLLYRLGSKIANYIKDINLKEDNTKKILIALGINFVVISIISLIPEAVVILTLLYSIFIFYIVRKYLDQIKSSYRKLFKITNEIANGNLDVKVDDDLGIFNDFKEEVEKIQSGFKNAVDKEVKSQKMKTELISNVSHDLKTPLTSIITYVDLLKDKSLSEDKKDMYLETLDKKSQRLKDLIEDLFEMSKASSGNVTLNKMDIDVVSLMKQTLLELDDKIKESSLKIRTNFSNEKIILSLDGQRTFRVFENLIVNITKYAMKGSRVYVDILDSEDKVDIILRNITENEIDFKAEDIVERFVRADKSRNTEGSGLGLSIAKNFVELQGGSFGVKIDGDLFKVIVSFKK